MGGSSTEEELRVDFTYEELPPNTSAGFSRACFVRPTRKSKLPAVPKNFGVETWAMRKIIESEWTELPPKRHVEKPPKLALLVFVKDRIHNAKIWTNWIRRAQVDGLEFKVFVHAYGISDPSEFQTVEFLEYVVKERARTSWCKMWEAEMLLLKYAMIDQDVTHFMVVSHDSIPVKPLRYIYQELERDPMTRMCADNNWLRPWPRAESWWLMRRADAELFVDQEAFVRENFLTACTEEQAWYYPLRVRMDNFGPGAEVRNECPMFTDWADGPKACKDWKQNVEHCNCDLLRASNRTDSGFCHPALFFEVSGAALKGLLESPFWFARKFSDGAVHDDAAALLE